MRVKPIFAWYDLWVGLFWDTAKRRLYWFPVPCLGLRIDLADEPACQEVYNGCVQRCIYCGEPPEDWDGE
jgi:hypothetical protein